MRDDLVTAEDLPEINRVLQLGDQVHIIPVKEGAKIYRIKRDEIKRKACNFRENEVELRKE